MTEHDKAAAEASSRGMAFLVDGMHVPAERIHILSVPDTIGPISAMRAAKVDARAALHDLQATTEQQHVDIKTRGQHLRWLAEAVGMEIPEDHSDAYLGLHCLITMMDIEAKVRAMRVELSDARADAQRMDWFDKRGQLSESKGHMRWVIVSDAGVTNVRLAMDSFGALS